MKGDNIGAFANSVNLLTGELAVPLNLVSIPGRAGIGINISVNYNSTNIENIVNLWNQDSPTGTLGLGWSLQTPLIFVDNKQTGTREDDEFYLSEGGASIKMICVGNSSGVRTYKTKSFSNWIIKFTAGVERWEITKDDGTKYTYGGEPGGGTGIQWIARWGNWIGNSMASGYQLQGFIWNLTEVKNVWGEKITYSYFKVENNPGGSTLSTQSSHLWKITDLWGHEVELNYGSKTVDEFEYAGQPFDVNKRLEKFYLNKLMVKTNSSLDHEYQFDYSINLLGTGKYTKRLLTSITKISPLGTKTAPVSFEYLATDPKGVLNKIILPTGGWVIFNYGFPTSYYSKLTTVTSNAPSGYAEPNVHLSENFAVVTWRQMSGSSHIEDPMDVVVRAYTWQGRWRMADLGSIGNVKFLNYQKDYRVVTEKDFFAILQPIYGGTGYNLSIWHLVEGKSGEWKELTIPLILEASLTPGSNCLREMTSCVSAITMGRYFDLSGMVMLGFEQTLMRQLECTGQLRETITFYHMIEPPHRIALQSTIWTSSQIGNL